MSHRSNRQQAGWRIRRALLLGIAASMLAGCSHYNGLRDYRGSPKFRKGAVPCQSFPNKFVEPNDLGRHCYHYSLKERSGIVYTTQAGHVDIAHVRKAADWTAYLAAESLKNILAEKRHWQFSLREPTRYLVHVDYPSGWASQEDRHEIAERVAIHLGEYLAYNATIWHEMLTWFGYRSTLVVSEFASAFSWEDNFSNLLGTILAAEALRNEQLSYNDAMTLELDKALLTLDVQPMSLAEQFAVQAKGEWYVKGFPIFMDVVKRNLDIGEDGIVQSITHEGRGAIIPVPDRQWQSYGFKISLEILPRGFRTRGIRKVIAKSRLLPENDFKTIMDVIEQDAYVRGYDVIR